jgi:hypothetical protein
VAERSGEQVAAHHGERRGCVPGEPLRAATEKRPKPVIATSPPAVSSASIAASVASTGKRKALRVGDL